MDSERHGGMLSPEARRAVEGLLAGRRLDDVAPPGSAVRAEVEAHLIASLRVAGPARRRPAPAKRGAKVAGSPARAARAAGAPDGAAHPVVAWSDGASRGNPGAAAIGILLVNEDGTELYKEGRRIGRATNNVAEYQGAIAVLEKARELGVAEIELRMDSELVVKQLLGLYRVKDPSLARLKADVDRLRGSFRKFRVRHVRREENGETDRLANLALDGKDG